MLSIDDLFDLSQFAHASLFQDCQFPWEPLVKLEDYFKTLKLGNIEVGIPSGVHLIHPEWISIGKGTQLEPGAYIKGPCIIGENCVLRQGSYIRGNVIVGNNCVVGHDSELKHAILLDNSKAPHFAYVGNSILGNGVNLGAGTILSNFRMDHQPISINGTATGLKKLGSLLGDGTQIGCNTVLNPGVIMGKNVYCYPALNVSGVIPANSRIKPSQNFLVTHA